MENKIVKLPQELNELSVKVSEHKQYEVQKVLNDVFKGTDDWDNQVSAIEVKGVDDLMSMNMADLARKNVKNARTAAEKIFDKKRKEVQERMMDDKLEDSLWLKSKQIMQLKFKYIEEKAKYKADFAKRHEEEQIKLRNELRLEKISKYQGDEDFFISDVLEMTDTAFEEYLAEIEKKYLERVASEKKAEQERIENERIEAEKRKAIQAENERLKKDAEERQAKERIEEKKRQEKEAKERLEYERKIKAEREAKIKVEKQLESKRQSELKAKKEAEEKIQFDLSKDDTLKVKDLIDNLIKLKTKYTFKSSKNIKMYSDVNLLIDKLVKHIEK